jgi:hypothetical protein
MLRVRSTKIARREREKERKRERDISPESGERKWNILLFEQQQRMDAAFLKR